MKRRRPSRRVARPEDWLPAPLPKRQGLLTPVIAHAFQALGVSVSLWQEGSFWHPIYKAENVSAFELQLDVMPRRWEYDWRMLKRARQEERLVVGEHAGFSDVFVPVRHADGFEGVLVVGPCAVERPTSADVVRRWYEISGSNAHLSHPLFSRYLSATLETLTLEGPMWGAFQRLLSCFARLLGGQGVPQAVASEAASMWQKVMPARFPERMWDAARNLIDERSARPPAPLDHGDMAAFGLDETPRHVVVGLLASRHAGDDPIADRIARATFQRACASFARSRGHTLCGRVADHGVVFLVDDGGTSARTPAPLLDLATRANALARRFGLRLHVGVLASSDTTALPVGYRAALLAAEKALAEGRSVVEGSPVRTSATDQLRELRANLGNIASEPPNLLPTRFDRYIEAVVAHTGYQLDLTRAQLQVGLERIADALLGAGLMDKNAFDESYSSLEQKADAAVSVTELVAAYRGVVAEMERILRSPAVARHDRGTHRALAFIRDHVTDPLTLAQVARVAGFAPDYFGRLFQREVGTSFGRYWQRMRIDRAKQMIDATSLPIDSIYRLAGFRTRTHFHCAFKAVVGMTPIQYRERGW